jgi:hypothetical protein
VSTKDVKSALRPVLPRMALFPRATVAAILLIAAAHTACAAAAAKDPKCVEIFHKPGTRTCGGWAQGALESRALTTFACRPAR